MTRRGSRCRLSDAAQIRLTLDPVTRCWQLTDGQADGFPLEGQPGGPYCQVHGDDWDKCPALKDLPPLPPTLAECHQLIGDYLADGSVAVVL